MFFRRFFSLVFLIITLTVLLHACTTQSRRIFYDPPVWAPDSQQLAFAAKQGENWDIYRVNVDGTGLTQLTTHPEFDRYPDWAPDGQSIVFSSHRDRSYKREQNPGDCCGDIYVMDTDSSSITRLTQEAYFPDSPKWSPNGKRIVFVSDDEIYVMEADGRNQTKLVSNRDEDGQRTINTDPKWSPDSNQITFTSSGIGIFLVDANGSNLIKLPGDFEAHSPFWSFDGQKIVYSKTKEFGYPKDIQFISQGIWIVDAQASGQPKKLADGNGAAWSPNSQRIAFSCETDANKDDAKNSSICLINSDGLGLTRLNYSGSFLTWSPDGTKIAFINQSQDRESNIYVTNSDGSGLIQLTRQSK